MTTAPDSHDGTMHPRTNELLDYIDSQHEHLRSTYESVPADQRDRRSSPSSWSVNDVVCHLAILEARLAGVLAKLLSEARTTGLRAETDTSPLLSTIDVTPVLDRNAKITAPDRVDPTKTGDALGWSDYERAHSAMREVLVANDGFALNDVLHPHPVFGPLGGYQWFAFTGAHAARHAAQIREIAATNAGNQ